MPRKGNGPVYVRLSENLDKEELEVTIMDLNGKLMYRSAIPVTDGSIKLKVPDSCLKGEIYLVSVRCGGWNKTFRLSLQHNDQ